LFAGFDALNKAFAGGYGLVLLRIVWHWQKQERGREEVELKEWQLMTHRA
jgi:hypothetical protein